MNRRVLSAHQGRKMRCIVALPFFPLQTLGHEHFPSVGVFLLFHIIARWRVVARHGGGDGKADTRTQQLTEPESDPAVDWTPDHFIFHGHN